MEIPNPVGVPPILPRHGLYSRHRHFGVPSREKGEVPAFFSRVELRECFICVLDLHVVGLVVPSPLPPRDADLPFPIFLVKVGLFGVYYLAVAQETSVGDAHALRIHALSFLHKVFTHQLRHVCRYGASIEVVHIVVILKWLRALIPRHLRFPLLVPFRREDDYTPPLPLKSVVLRPTRGGAHVLLLPYHHRGPELLETRWVVLPQHCFHGVEKVILSVGRRPFRFNCLLEFNPVVTPALHRPRLAGGFHCLLVPVRVPRPFAFFYGHPHLRDGPPCLYHFFFSFFKDHSPLASLLQTDTCVY